MDPYFQLDLDAERRALIKNFNRQTQIMMISARSVWENNRNRKMASSELARALGWDHLTIPDLDRENTDFHAALETALVKRVEVQNFQRKIMDLRPKKAPKNEGNLGSTGSAAPVEKKGSIPDVQLHTTKKINGIFTRIFRK